MLKKVDVAFTFSNMKIWKQLVIVPPPRKLAFASASLTVYMNLWSLWRIFRIYQGGENGCTVYFRCPDFYTSEVGLDMSCLVASVMSSSKIGVQAKGAPQHPNATYVHCRSHVLNLAISSESKSVPSIRNLFWQCRKVNMVFRWKYCEMFSVLVLEYTVCFQINRTSEIML